MNKSGVFCYDQFTVFTELKVDVREPQMDEHLGYSSPFTDVWTANMTILAQAAIALNAKTHM